VGAPEPAKRGHYALAAGEDPLPYLQAMAAMAGPLGLLPEQVWDATPPADAEHPAGRPTGAHAELVKLQASRRLGRPFDRPTPVWRRYGGRPPAPTLAVWTPWAPIRTLWRGERLCVCLPEAGVVHWGRNGWREVRDVATVPAGFGLHRALLTDAGLGSGETVELTWRGELTGWSGQEVVIGVCEPGQ
jgi:glucoamylase